MSVALADLNKYLSGCMEPDKFQDYCPNGLQVEGRAQIARLATGVTACQRLLDAAIEWRADAILVHHGYFWRGEDANIIGIKRRRLGALLSNDISLFAYHLPLDAHPQFGNNACLGQRLGFDLKALEPLQPEAQVSIGNVGNLVQAVAAEKLVQKLEKITGRVPLHVGDSAALVRRIAWCTGAAQGYIDLAVAAGAELYITGEASEQTVHTAREEGIQFIAAGHHATERYGVQTLGTHLAQQFQLEHRFFDIDNPV